MSELREKADARTYPPGLPAHLGDGLLLRAVRTTQDVQRLAHFNGFVNQDPAVGALTHSWLGGSHPAVALPDFLYVEDTEKGEIVSTLGLLLQTWTYDGIPLRVGQVELVGTHPDYRSRGLIRAQIEVIERMLEARGCALSCVEGIPYFYRQFGYEYAIPLGSCAKLSLEQVPALAEGREEPVAIRRMNADTDVHSGMALYGAHAAELCVVSVRHESLWRFQEAAPAGIPQPLETYVVEDNQDIIGYFRVRKNMWGPLLEFAEGSARPSGQLGGSQGSWMAVLRFARELAAQRNYPELCFALPRTHPLVTVARYLGAESERQYAWQIRIMDHADFVQRIAPALEVRLAKSLLAGFSGSLNINTMPSRIRLQFNDGRLVSVRDGADQEDPWGLRMPPLLLTQLLLGYRSCQEIMECHLDASVRPAARQLVDVLFPKTESFIYQAI
jgi:GNAT superfamily N-acetyltransferase